MNWIKTLKASISTLTARIHGYFAHARAHRSLAALDDHMLHDLGISRAEIDYVIARGRPRMMAALPDLREVSMGHGITADALVARQLVRVVSGDLGRPENPESFESLGRLA